jgi:hypothetical protein
VSRLKHEKILERYFVENYDNGSPTKISSNPNKAAYSGSLRNKIWRGVTGLTVHDSYL